MKIRFWFRQQLEKFITVDKPTAEIFVHDYEGHQAEIGSMKIVDLFAQYQQSVVPTDVVTEIIKISGSITLNKTAEHILLVPTSVSTINAIYKLDGENQTGDKVVLHNANDSDITIRGINNIDLQSDLVLNQNESLYLEYVGLKWVKM